jgi:glycosyltransferase 2 family protein
VQTPTHSYSRSFPWHTVKRFLRIAGIIIPLGAWAFFLFKQLDQLQAHEWEVSMPGLIGSLFLGTIYFLIMALGWAFLLYNMAGIKKMAALTTFQAMRAWLLTIMSRYLPGNVWHIFSRMAFADKLNVGKAQILSSSTMEQGLAVIGAMLIAAFSLPFWPLAAIPQAWLPNFILLTCLFLLGLALLHPRILGPIIRWAAFRLHKPELNWNFEYKTIIKFVLIYALAAFFAGLALVAVMAGLGEFRATDMIFIIGSSALAWVVGYLSFITPSGLGVREGVLTALLALVYPLPIAIVASLLFRVVCTLGEFAAVLFFLGFKRIAYPGAH